jgi:hypothetical protein
MSRPLIDYARAGLRLDLPVFDVHAHIGNLIGEDTPPLDAQVAQMDRLGILAMAVSSEHALVGDIVRGNDEVAEAMRRFPGRILGYCHVSANYPDFLLPEVERCFRNDGFRGIKLYQVGPEYDDPAYDPVWAFAEERGLPVLAHTWGGNLTGFDRAADKHPGVPCLAAHAGSSFAYKPYIEAAKRVPNFYLDLTYSREHTNMIEHFVAELGAERVVWGSDAPLFSMPQQLCKVLFARISDEEKRKILYDNAAGWFRLTG